MIPLWYFLIAWIVLILIHAIFTLFTISQMLKHGVPGFVTYFTTFIFITGIILVIFGSASYFITIDWNTSIQPIPQDLIRLFNGGEGPVIDIPLE